MINEARLHYVAQQMAPRRACVRIVEQRPTPDTLSGVTLELDCGHHLSVSLHHHYEPGERHPCGDCGLERARQLPEFTVRR